MSHDPSIDVAHLARLSRLLLSEEQAEAARADLERIIGMIDAMQAVDTADAAPMAHPLDATLRLREDRVTERVDPEHFQRHAPLVEDNYYLVPRVVE